MHISNQQIVRKTLETREFRMHSMNPNDASGLGAFVMWPLVLLIFFSIYKKYYVFFHVLSLRTTFPACLRHTELLLYVRVHVRRAFPFDFYSRPTGIDVNLYVIILTIRYISSLLFFWFDLSDKYRITSKNTIFITIILYHFFLDVFLLDLMC